MSDFLKFLNENQGGIFILFLCIVGLMLLAHYAMWIFRLGRFNREVAKPRERLNFVLADAAVKIINDFRHLLALLLVVVFSTVLGYAIIRGGNDANGIKDSLQAVMATLGGLVGSIIGYYFGESAARSGVAAQPQANPPNNPQGVGSNAGETVQPPQENNPLAEADIEEAPPPEV